MRTRRTAGSLPDLLRFVTLVVAISTAIGPTASGAQELPLDGVPFARLPGQCIHNHLSEACREQLRLLMGEMSPSIKSLYKACVEQLPIDRESPFALSIHVACRRLAEGDSDGQYDIGRHFDYGWGFDEDPISAAQWYEKAAQRGHVEAQHSLGLLNVLAIPNPAESAKWFRAAAEQDHASSQHFLGKAYEDGKGVPRNFDEAARWYRRAAVQGDGMAMSALAGLYARGLGVEKSVIKAYAWVNVAATQGWGMAKSYRDGLEQDMTSTQISDAQALSMRLLKQYGPSPNQSDRAAKGDEADLP